MTTPPTLDEARRLFHDNRLTEALAECERLIEHQTDTDEALHIRAAVLLKQGRTDDALQVLVDSLALQETASKLNTLAAAHLARGDGASARDALERARALTGDDPRMWPNLGRALLLEGRVDEAADLLKRTVVTRPDWAPGWFVHGTVEAARGDVKSAAQAFDEAFQLDPAFTDACHQAAVCWQSGNRRDLARARWLSVLAADPDRVAARAGLLDALPWAYESAEPAVVAEVEKALDDGRYLMQPACDALPAFLRGARPWQIMFRRAHDPEFRLTDEEVATVSSSTLLPRLLRAGIVTDLGMERVLAAWRRRFLEGAGRDDRGLELAAAIAAHNHLAGYAWIESPEEASALGDADPLARAMYRPPQADEPRLRPLVEAAERERVLGAAVPQVGSADFDVVADRYEAHPYPRWETLDRARSAVDLDDVIRGLCPWLRDFHGPARAPGEPLRILVAGCGTGRHALAVAMRFKEARVVGLDASAASLGYAARKMEVLGIDNVEWVRGDITRLEPGDFPEPFHVVEAVGVLHHLERPRDAWARLVALLAPRGLMKIGLYSQAGRAVLDPARAIARDTDGCDAAAMRALRKRLLSDLPPEARVALLQFTEFYTTAGLADLLRHPREREYTLDGVAADLHALGLTFLGFENVAPPIRQALLDAHGPAAGQDLTRWTALENAQPHVFRHMYQFWCQRA